MVVDLQRNYLKLLQNETDIAYIQNIRFKKMIVFVKVIVYIKSTWWKLQEYITYLLL